MDNYPVLQLEFNGNTRPELFIRLPKPHENIIITPTRESDAHALTVIMNDPKASKKPCDDILSSHSNDELLDSNIPIDGCPVNAIREIKEDGREIYIGQIIIQRSRCMRWMDQPDIRKQKLQENNSKPIGDPHVYHDLSMFLASSHHNRGIATAALKALMGTWYIPRSKVKNIEAGVFNGNKGSARVLEKSGWILEEVFNLGGKGKTQSGELIETIESYYWRAARPSGTADEVTVHNV